MVWQVLEQQSLPTGLVRAVSKVQTVADKSLKPVGSRVRWIIWALGVFSRSRGFLKLRCRPRILTVSIPCSHRPVAQEVDGDLWRPKSSGQQKTGFEAGFSTLGKMAGVAGLEPVTSAVTGQRSNQLSYTPALGSGRCFLLPSFVNAFVSNSLKTFRTRAADIPENGPWTDSESAEILGKTGPSCPARRGFAALFYSSHRPP